MSIKYIRKNNKSLIEYGIFDPLRSKQEVKNMKTKIEDTIKIEDGKHEGKIKELIYKTEPHKYLDVVITTEIDGKTFDLKCGVPHSITENTALGQMLQNFGAKLEVGAEIDPDDFLKVESVVEFVTVMKKTDRGTFANIQPLSIKPKK